ncbi:transcriptional regulator [Neiella marina]|uniref:Transcriptional regulator n=1 Tax=Neiella marina TaxID=508461 RepID=A0A8J2XQI9_9GAMM|nr:AraC family transcriptional regulator [Neiella marina]GGA85099.1 transcriptional regulator [Neiella marina]
MLTVDELNLLLRCFSIGNLILLASLCIGRKLTVNIVLLFALFVGFAHYIVLTAPVSYQLILSYRNGLLFFTELLPVLIFLFVLDFSPACRSYQYYERLRISTLVAAIVLYGVCFLLLAGRGVLHSISHVIGLILLIASGYLCFRQINDDLVDKRRTYRFVFGGYLMLHFCVLVLFELFTSQSDGNLYLSLTNSALIFLATLVGVNIHVREPQPIERGLAPQPSTNEQPSDNSMPPAMQQRAAQLELLMSEGAYLENGLTIGKLSEQLKLPEHRLRKLINEGLGYKNFSSYLNSYRIPQACQMLKDRDNAEKPILSIALELGFGSISPFNRAFKQATGNTPTEYRDHHTKLSL